MKDGVVFYRNSVGSIVHIENITSGPEQGIGITVGKGEDERNFDGCVLYFNNEDDFRNWLIMLNKTFGGLNESK